MIRFILLILVLALKLAVPFLGSSDLAENSAQPVPSDSVLTEKEQQEGEENAFSDEIDFSSLFAGGAISLPEIEG